MKILTVVGARPQFIKAAAVSRVLRRTPGVREVLLHTGQHYDDNMSEIFFRELNIPEPDYNLEVGSGSHAVQTGQMLRGIEEVLLQEMPDLTLVFGDTNSTLAGALASVKLHIRVAHVEAGLRSFNRSMPEEINRIVADRVSDLLFAPTRTAVENLRTEGLEKATRFTGDVMYDSVLYYAEEVRGHPEKYAPPCQDGYLLATIHRAENTDRPENLRALLDALGASGKEVLLPVHPRTRKHLTELTPVPPNIRIIDPVGYLQMLSLTLNSEKVLTDSGGLQKEAYFLGKPCITLRSETEWVETLHDGWNVIAGTDPGKILAALQAPLPSAPKRDEFGNGKACELIAGFLS
jgi:UDP-GlcNAc3NAcA epimerase